ncbi:MAG TPA: hypothetical protein VGR40_01185 [Candidatus Binatus sp.]|nr:hypothetical protein [Candidatus Binatus sp.]
MVPPSRVEPQANGCLIHVVDDAAPLSQWKKVGVFWDQDVCQGTPYKLELTKERLQQTRELVEKKAEAGDQASIELEKCWNQKGYVTWTAPASSSLVRHEPDAAQYACVEKDDPRLVGSNAVNGSPQVAGK